MRIEDLRASDRQLRQAGDPHPEDLGCVSAPRSLLPPAAPHHHCATGNAEKPPIKPRRTHEEGAEHWARCSIEGPLSYNEHE